MSLPIRGLALALICLPMMACQTTSPHEAFKESQDDIHRATGQSPQWLGRSTDEKQLADAMAKLLGGPLTMEQAVQVSLINNRTMQARFEELGIARAELVQAGLLKNPMFDAQIRWPSASPSGTNVEFAIVQDFISVLLIPMKKKVAAARLRGAVHTVTHEAIALTSDVRAAFVVLRSETQIVEIKEADALAAEAAGDLAERIYKAGNESELQYTKRMSKLENARAELAQAKSEEVDAREKFAVLLGMSGDDGFTISQTMPTPPMVTATKKELEATAVSRRQDLAAKRDAIVAMAASLGLSKSTALVPELRIGGDAEHEADGGWLAGPNISLQIPLFDQGQAQVAKSDSQLRQARFEYDALESRVRSETREAYNHAITSHARLTAIVQKLIPLQDRLLEQTQLHHSGMLASTFDLLEARQSQLATQAMRIRAEADRWLALIALQRAIAGPLPETESATQPTPATQPASPTPQPHNHTH